MSNGSQTAGPRRGPSMENLSMLMQHAVLTATAWPAGSHYFLSLLQHSLAGLLNVGLACMLTVRKAGSCQVGAEARSQHMMLRQGTGKGAYRQG